jgi:hypothetical protein
MSKYHINPETGNPNKCTAKPGNCRFGSDSNHYESKEIAREKYEEHMQGNNIITKQRELERQSQEYDYQERDYANDEDEDGVSYKRVRRFESEHLPEAVALIEKANRRLEKYGIKERFEYEVEETFKEYESVGGMKISKAFTKLTLNSPTISFADNKFLAVVTQEEKGLITKTGEDVELNGWRPDSMKCEHCGHNRPRSKTYLIEDKDGKRSQIGSTCVEAYLGVKPEGLWAVGADPVENMSSGGGSTNAYNMARPTNHMIAYAIAVSDEGKDFVTRGAAQWGDRKSTADDIEAALWSKDPKERAWREKIELKATEFMNNGKADEVLNFIRNLEGDNDYVTNLRTVAAGEMMKPSNSALLVSGIGSYYRDQIKKQRELEKANKPKKVAAAVGWVGEIGDKMKDKKATVVGVWDREVRDDYTGHEVTRSQVRFRDENGHELIWWASKKIEVEEGAEVIFKGGSIKKHDHFNGTDQTSLTRVKFEEIKEDSDNK